MKSKQWLPITLMVLFAFTRMPGMLPQNFSAVYALFFCAGVYFSGVTAWWLPLTTMVITDVLLDLHYLHLGYSVFKIPNLETQLFNYVAYVCLILLGRRFSPRSSFLGLLGGGILGSILFYLITNTASWFFNPFGNPEYTKNLHGWLQALTLGTAGWPETWQFFRNTLMSGGLFTGLFVGACKLTAATESKQEKKDAEATTPEAGDEEPAGKKAPAGAAAGE